MRFRIEDSRKSCFRAALLAAGLLSLLLAPSALAAPDTMIDSDPIGVTNNPTPTFQFSSPDDPTATFECKVDVADPFASCSGPDNTHTTDPLVDGPHTFEVRAIDAVPEPDPTPASETFTVDTIGPDHDDRLRPDRPDRRQHADLHVLRR